MYRVEISFCHDVRAMSYENQLFPLHLKSITHFSHSCSVHTPKSYIFLIQ